MKLFPKHILSESTKPTLFLQHLGPCGSLALCCCKSCLIMLIYCLYQITRELNRNVTVHNLCLFSYKAFISGTIQLHPISQSLHLGHFSMWFTCSHCIDLIRWQNWVQYWCSVRHLVCEVRHWWSARTQHDLSKKTFTDESSQIHDTVNDKGQLKQRKSMCITLA